MKHNAALQVIAEVRQELTLSTRIYHIMDTGVGKLQTKFVLKLNNLFSNIVGSCCIVKIVQKEVHD